MDTGALSARRSLGYLMSAWLVTVSPLASGATTPVSVPPSAPAGPNLRVPAMVPGGQARRH